MSRKIVQEPRARASWSGQLKFGLVSFSVQAFNAIERDTNIVFHQLHNVCHSRIRYEKHCPLHGKVDNDEIVSGYEYAKDKYVEIEPEELDELRSERDRSLTVDTFIDPEMIDPIYFDGRIYYLAPDGTEAAEPYAVFLKALARSERWGIGQVVFSGKEQIALIRPYNSSLHMAMLNYAAELRDPDKVVGSLPAVAAGDKTLKLAQQLIAHWEDDKFNFSSYVDNYQKKVHELIEAKIEGREVVVPEAEDEPQIVNLMDALKRSMSRSRRSKPAAKKAVKATASRSSRAKRSRRAS